MNTITKLFVPSGRKFYELYEQVAENLAQMAGLFSEHIVAAERQKRRSLLDKIERMENKNDEATHKLFVELSRNFVTPFDREDIHFMATSLDDVADMIWAASKQMYHYDIEPSALTQDMSKRLIGFVALLGEALRGLRNRKDLNALIAILENMRKLTYESESNISSGISSLFNAAITPVDMIKLSDHYNVLQALNNKCSEVINVLEGVIIKYG